MRYQPFVDAVDINHRQFKYDRAILWSCNKPITDLTLAMPFKEYSELLLDLMNQPNFIMTPSPTVGIIKHFTVNGIKVHIVDGDSVGWGLGLPKENQKFFETFSFEPLAHQQKKKEPPIPGDAYDFEVFHIKEDQAFLGFKLANGNFHYIQVPYNPGKHEAKVIQMQTLPHRA